ncbi:hypothetical protein LP420_24215 [Massilia sp. B-10]|nr:hypothetical protein LP420_24215 [Massilia sp. B-10]
MKLTNLKIGVRLGLGFGVVLTLLALLVGLGLHKLDVVNTALLEVTEQGNVKLDAAEDMSVAQMRVTIATSNVVLLTDHAAMAVHEGKIAAARRLRCRRQDLAQHGQVRQGQGHAGQGRRCRSGDASADRQGPIDWAWPTIRKKRRACCSTKSIPRPRYGRRRWPR